MAWHMQKGWGFMHTRVRAQRVKAVERGRFQLVIVSVLKSGDCRHLPCCLTCLMGAEEPPFTMEQHAWLLAWL